MLNNKYFHFKTFLDEISDLIFFKSQKILLRPWLGIFIKLYIFSKNQAVTFEPLMPSNFLRNI